MSTQGIQTLLEAEREASKVVTKARQYRVQKLKDAKSDAVKEVEALKAQKEKEYQDFLANLNVSDDSAKLNQLLEQKLEEIKTQTAQHKEEVIQKLLDAVLRIKPQVHPNAQLRK
ncbi:hypothetical protein MP228_007380 [Amoeboaphelidium protococcarum]|nr:hypothetical protein MP228_007380 [Amoeboaphelidium protococcarum]